QVTQYQLGNGLLTTKGYDPYGFPTSIFTEGACLPVGRAVQDLEYDFNIHSGNLNWRQATVSGQTLKENFTYDVTGLNNRLLTWQVSGGTQYSVDYYANGNMNTKTGIGTYLYGTGNDGPHAVSRIKDPDAAYLAMAKINKQELTYTGFDKTATIRQYNPANQEQASALEITYGPGQSRKMTKLFLAGDLVKTKIFVDGTYETETDANGNLQQLHYISGGDGLFAIYVIDQAGKATMNYIHKDYQGSFETITNHKGTVVEKLSYDPWGRRRNPTNWTFTNVTESYKFDRGYTGHEHLDQFGLINMNGRMYDPMLGRFLSPDNYVQAPDYTQNFNRYSYVLNNPLKYTDPSGEFVQFIIGGIIGGISGYMIGKSAGLKGWALVGTTLGGVVIGAGTAGIGTAISGSVGGAGGTILAGSTAGAAGTASFSSMTALANGGNINDIGYAHFDGIWKGTLTGIAGSSVGGAIGGGWGALAGGATAGGLGTALNGGSGSDIFIGAMLGGVTSFGTYHLTAGISYEQYRKSGMTFEGHTLSYKQFNGMSADFQRSSFWKREFGGVLTEGGRYVHRYRIHPLRNPKGGTEINWDVENLPWDTYATSHSHFAKAGTIAPDGGTYVQYHSPKDIRFDNRFNISSFTVNRFDANFNSVVGLGNTECYFSAGFVRNPYNLLFFGLY
ncbi:MAG: hypothetical protein CO098_17620, partial [Bacteroidetes bacterium CG_4_9_14_3_um_filter_41_19]